MFVVSSAHSAPAFVPVCSLAPRSVVAMIGMACNSVFSQVSPPGEGQLPPVTVTATRFAEQAGDLPFGVSVLSASDIRAADVTTVNEAVMKLLGVAGRQDSFGGGDYGLDLRGFGAAADSNQVVIVDGIRINEADLSGTRLAGIAIDSVERIEVIRGSGAVLYGEGATGGVIVIITKASRGVARENQAEGYAAVGSFGLREMRGTGSLVAGELSLDVSANQRNADNHRDNFRSKIGGASATGQWRNDWLRLGLRHSTDHLDTGLPGALTTAQYAADPRQTTAPLDSARIVNGRSGVFGDARFGDWQIGLDAGWRTKALTSQNSGVAYDYDVDASTYAVRAKHTAQLGAVANSLAAGIDRGEWTRTVQGAFASVASQRSDALYLKDEAALPGGTRLSAGWRTEAVTANIDQRQQAWELGLVQPLMAGVSAFARFGRSFRLANVDEFSFTSPGLTLEAQISRDTELGGRWTFAGGRAELRLYRSALSYEIGYDPNAVGFGVGANVNFDSTRRQGAELEVAQSLGGGANLRLNAAVRRAQFMAGRYDGKDVPLTPRHTLSARVDGSPAAGHRIDAGVNWVSSQSPDFDNACRMPGYTTLDLRYAYRWQRVEVALAVNNLAGAKYTTQAFACVNGAVSSIYPEAGRAVTASVRLQF